MAVEIKKSILVQQVQDGWKRKALAEHYGLPEAQMAQILRDAGLKIRKFQAPKYQLVDDTVDNVQETGEDVSVVNNEVTAKSVEIGKEVTTETNW